MFFLLSKLFWLLVQPVSLTFLLVLIGWLAVLMHLRTVALVATSIGLLVLGLSSFTSLGFLLIRPLEERFDRPRTMPPEVQAIVMLGGATAGRVSTSRGIAELMEAGDRLTETLRLAQVYPDVPIVLSGGVGLLNADDEPEAITAKRFFTSMGIREERLIVEGQSRNTDENADLTARLLSPDAGAVLLVTSAFHMPRSVGLFGAAGVDVVPWPVDFRSSGEEAFGLDFANLPLNLNTTGVALREWIGLAAYRLTGKIADWFPAPQPGVQSVSGLATESRIGPVD